MSAGKRKPNLVDLVRLEFAFGNRLHPQYEGLLRIMVRRNGELPTVGCAAHHSEVVGSFPALLKHGISKIDRRR